MGSVILIGHAPAFTQLAHLVLFSPAFRLNREGQRPLCLRAKLVLGKQRPRGGQVWGRIRSCSLCEFGAVEQRLEQLDRRRVGVSGEPGVEDRDRQIGRAHV